ncbi:MAG: hypothetical protein IT198_16135 [Acidimicrobiia bacterium]|nr:hypothetical protein [Acidimicrobiia bacterium]
MAKRSKKGKRRRRRTGPPPNTAAPKIHIKVAVAETDLRNATQLVKSAILYADRVTVYSPVASLVGAVADLGDVTAPQQQVALLLDIVRQVPSLAARLDAPADELAQLEAFLAVDPRLMRQAAAAHGGRGQIDKVYEQLQDLSSVWEDEMPEAIEKAKETVGAEELLVAVEAGAVNIADLGAMPTSEVIIDSLSRATGATPGTVLDEMILGFTARIVDMLSEPRAFPLLDAQSSGLARALERETVASPSLHAMRRGSEVASAASFMGYLPYFPALPMDEVLDLRKSLSKPLIRFRGALAKLSREFQSRPIDEAFESEVEEAWRAQVAPALADIREGLAEHGLLREAASIAQGDLRRLLTEAGGVLAAGSAEILPLSALLMAGLAASVPVADVAGRAVLRRREARTEARKNAFYFLHRLAEESN